MKKIIYIGFLLVFFLESCYEDKGNYDYKQVNEIAISGIKESYEVNVGEKLIIKPELSFKLGEIKNLTYRWRVDTVVISDSIILDIDVNLGVKAGYYGDFAVIDPETGIAYMEKFKLSVSSKYRSGWLLLSKQSDRVKLDYITDDNEIIEDVYETFNDAKLPHSCRRINEILHSSWYESSLGQILIMNDEGADQSVILDGASFKKVVNLNEEFVDSKAPQGMIPMAYAVGGVYHYIVDQNGKVYSKYSKNGNFQEGFFNQFPVIGDYKMLPMAKETVAMPGTRAGVLFFDISNPVKGYQYMYAYEGEVVAYDTTKDAQQHFDLIGMDKVVMGMGPGNDYGSGCNYFSVFLKSKEEDKYFVQSLGFGMTWGRTPWMASFYETEFPDPSIVNQNSLIATEFGRDRIYIATGSKLYVYDMLIGENEETENYSGVTKSIIPLYNFGDGKTIKSISCGYSPDRGKFELGVAVENGDKGDFYLMDVSSEGTSIPWECAIFEKYEGLMGRPLQVLYKIGDPWRLYL